MISVVSEEIHELERSHKSVSISVDSLETRFRSEVSNSAETLSSAFKCSLAITDGDEESL